MSLAPGVRLGSYEVVAPLGAGGMGEVYRARDTKLGRDVAIKILPDAFAGNPDRLARFEREARTLAALNHPHIAQIYGLDEGPAGGGRTRALVMEFVEGRTLDAVIHAEGAASRGIDVRDALAIARQIADALEAAHERGIVHRDLKPANVMVTGDGTVKVLDFGLAKGFDAPSADLMNSPTFTSPATELGVILGTAAYMAPEQAKGRAVDKRADIWAFGCVLYEMLTGTPAFQGASTAELLSAVITKEPDLDALPPSVPARVKFLLRRCLDKDAKQRLRDIGEARIALSEAPQAHAGPVVRQTPRRRWPWLTAAAALTAMAGLGGFAFGRERTTPIDQPVTSFAQMTDQPGLERQPTLSPDGKSIVFVSAQRGNEDLYLLRVGGRRAVLLTEDSAADDFAPSFSPDGSQIAFRSERAGGGIFVMDATGESVRRITDQGFDPRWSPSGTELVVADEAVLDPMSRNAPSRLWVVKIADGSRRLVAQGDAVGGRFSPDGHRIAYWGMTGSSVRDIWTVPSDGSGASSPVKVTDDDAVDWGPAWSPDGSFLYFSSTRGGTMNLWRVRIDQHTGRTLGDPEAMTTPTAWSGNVEFSSDGDRLVFTDQDERSTIWAVAFDPTRGVAAGAPRAILQSRAINSVDISPDGSRVVFSQRLQPWEALGVVAIDGSGWSRLTDDEFYHRAPVWSRDGRRILFYSNRSGRRVFTVLDDGSGLRELPLPHVGEATAYPILSPDESRLALAGDDAALIFDTATSPMTQVARVPNRTGEWGFLPFSWSADGRSIAGTARFSPTSDRLVILDVPSKTLRTAAEDGKSPAWLPDGRRLLFSSRTNIMLLDTVTNESRPILPLDRDVLQWGRHLSLSRDGRKLVYVHTQTEGDVWIMTIGKGAPDKLPTK